MSSQAYDLIIIGGGIVGVATARDASLRGLKTLLIEKEDFGSGASTKTSKLAHGGLRYLEGLNFGLVRQSLRERNALLKNAEGFVYPLRFLFPIFKNTQKPAWLINAGLSLYDLFAAGSPMPDHRRLSKENVLSRYPFLKKDTLTCGFHYYDGAMQDGRLLIENMLSAEEAGANCLNYTRVSEFLFQDGKVNGVVYDGKVAYAKTIVNATGSFADSIRNLAGESDESVTGSKGIHLVLKKKMANDAILLLSPLDKRVFFLIPWEGTTLLGTTDTMMPFLEKPKVLGDDIAYLLSSANAYLETPLTADDIASTFAGVRPLIYARGQDTYSASRNAQISTSESGLITVIGGKYTTFRAIAEEIVNTLTSLPCVTNTLAFSASPACRAQEAKMSWVSVSGFQIPLLKRLTETWVTRAPFCLEEILSRKDGQDLICPHHPLTVGELAYSVLREKVQFAHDWQLRRTTSGYLGLCTQECTERIENLIQKIKAERDHAN